MQAIHAKRAEYEEDGRGREREGEKANVSFSSRVHLRTSIHAFSTEVSLFADAVHATRAAAHASAAAASSATLIAGERRSKRGGASGQVRCGDRGRRRRGDGCGLRCARLRRVGRKQRKGGEREAKREEEGGESRR